MPGVVYAPADRVNKPRCHSLTTDIKWTGVSLEVLNSDNPDGCGKEIVRKKKPVGCFSDPEEFATVHREGTLSEFNAQKGAIDKFNDAAYDFKAWTLTEADQDSRYLTYLVLIALTDRNDGLLPKLGEVLDIKLLAEDGEPINQEWYSAVRIENPCHALGITAQGYEKTAVFSVKLPVLPSDPHNLRARRLMKPFHSLHGNGASLGPLYKQPCIYLAMRLEVSETTMAAEVDALDRLMNEHETKPSKKQLAAFHYIVTFDDPRNHVNLMATFKHMDTRPIPGRNPHNIPEGVARMLNNFNDDQRDALRGLRSIPEGIYLLPGCPGAGKTYWNTSTIAFALCKDIEAVNQHGQREMRAPKVLYVCDLNDPLTDIADRQVQVFADLGMSHKKVIRMFGWPRESNNSTRLNNASAAAAPSPSASSSDTDDTATNFVHSFLRTSKLRLAAANNGADQSRLRAKSLDDAAWDYYDAHRGEFAEIAWFLAAMSEPAWKKQKDKPAGGIKRYVYKLYEKVLKETDVVFTTPVAARQNFDGIWEPDLIFFDEAPHARELSNLIVLAFFKPYAWIFTGDFRQTRPYVGNRNENPHGDQMSISMMERAERSDAISRGLMINHRSFGNLHVLPSKLFYGGKMQSGINDMFPTNMQPTLAYLRSLCPHGTFNTTRVIVQVHNGEEKLRGCSYYNPKHIGWTMAEVKKIVLNRDLRRVGRKKEHATVLIICPYRETYNRYRSAVRALHSELRGRVDVEGLVDVRTLDTSQGHEADFVFNDLARTQRGTPFLDEANRLCVAITRARQAEIIVMNPAVLNLVRPGVGWVRAKYLNQIWNDVHKDNQIVSALDQV